MHTEEYGIIKQDKTYEQTIQVFLPCQGVIMKLRFQSALLWHAHCHETQQVVKGQTHTIKREKEGKNQHLVFEYPLYCS